MAALGTAGQAVAAQKTLHVHAFARPECHINAPTTSVRLPAGTLVNNDGKVRNGIANTVANSLTGLGIHAWCTGNSNAVNLYRTALVNQVHNGATGPGTQDANGFDTAVIYDLDVDIVGATRSDNAPDIDGTSDGQGNGPGFGVGGGITVSDFGPTGQGAKVSFKAESGQTPSAVTNNAGTGATSLYTADNHRLAAGRYESNVTLVLKPGV